METTPSFEELRIRTQKALKNADIDLLDLKSGNISANELKMLPHLGQVCVNEIRHFLADIGYTLKNEKDVELINRAREKFNKDHASSPWSKLQLHILYSCRKTFHETINEVNKKENVDLMELYDALESHKKIVQIYMNTVLDVKETYENK